MGAEIETGAELAGYRIERLLGRGGMGAVYLAHDERLGRRVAIKVLPPEYADDERFRERFLREWQVAASLEHPHVVPLFDAGEADGRLYIATRYIEGSDLRRLITEQGALEPEHALRLAAQIAGALDAAHARGLVHRDVKPANVLIDLSGNGYLSDFGLTKDVSSISGLTGIGQLVGTIEYMSPELIRAQPLDGRADQYALACVVFESLTGLPPYRRESEAQLLWAHVHDPVPRVSELRQELPSALDDVLAAGMAKSPDDRYRSCGELTTAALGALADGEFPTAERARAGPVVRTFLIADMRGYTRYTHERGDEAAAQVAAAFAGIAEDAVQATGGTLQELRGDEAMCVFDSARSALRCAIELQKRAAADQLDLPVGIGLDAGEAVPVAGGYRGAALNLAARLCSLAGPSEVLASESVTHLAGTVEGVQYGRRRAERVKGVERPVTAIEILAPGESTPRSLGRRLRRARRGGRRWILVIVGATAAAGVAVGLAVTLSGGSSGGLAAITPGSVGRIDPGRNVFADDFQVGGTPSAVTVGARSVWTANESDGTISLLDPASGHVTSVPSGMHPGAVTAGAIGVWAASRIESRVVRVNTQPLEVLQPIRFAARGSIASPPVGLATGAGSVWIASGGTTVTRISPTESKITATLNPDLGANCLTFAARAVWVGGQNAAETIDPSTNELAPQTTQLPGNAVAIATGENAVFVVTSNPSWLVRIDPTTRTVSRTQALDAGAAGVAVGAGSVWVTNTVQRTVVRIDVQTLVPVKTIHVGAIPTGVAFGAGSVWISAA